MDAGGLIGTILKIVFVLIIILTFAPVLIWAERRQSAMIGASECISLSAFGGTKSSFHTNFSASASGCRRPSKVMFLPNSFTPARVGPMRS